jgi:hypothetical protein
MPLEARSRGWFRWRRFIAACGVMTSLVALRTIAAEGEAGLISLWLLCAGIALAGLSIQAIRKERATQALLEKRGAERDRAEEGRRARWSWPRPRPTSWPCKAPTAN